MGKNVLYFFAIVVVGALLGSFFGHFLGMIFPEGSLHNLLSSEITAGLEPTRLDLRILEITFGCMLKFNMTSVLGILTAAFLFKTLLK